MLSITSSQSSSQLLHFSSSEETYRQMLHSPNSLHTETPKPQLIWFPLSSTIFCRQTLASSTEQGQFSSITPSQLSSASLHISFAGFLAEQSVQIPLIHLSSPFSQTEEHGLNNPLSVCPSQSLSNPSQISGDGNIASSQIASLFWQTVSWFGGPQFLNVSSSVCPSQSLSIPSQISLEGRTCSRHSLSQVPFSHL